MQRPSSLLLVVVLDGLLAVAAVAFRSGLPPETCDSGRLAFNIGVMPDPITAADRAGHSCAVVRSGVDSSLAATGGVTPCLCDLDASMDFAYSSFVVGDVPDMIYAPCGGQHVEQARRLAARCQEIINLWSPWADPSPSPSPSPSANEKGTDMPVEAISNNP